MADKLDGSAIVANTIPGTKIQSGTITTTQLSSSIVAVVNTPLHPKISSIVYPGNDTAANTGGGDSIVIRGSGFGTNVQVYINGNAVPSLTRNNANAVTITTAAQSAGTYLVYLINTDDGGTAILVPGIQYSGMPSWVTTSPLTGQEAFVAWSISLSATGDTPITYALQSGSSLPAGITLAANGLISGTMTSPPAEDTTYNFTVVATDPQFQDTPKAFSVAVTVAVDTQFQYTTLLLQADGTNNGNNHTFLDSSNNNFTITRNGNATQGSFTPFSPTGWSNFFDGSGDYLTATSPNLSGTWTVELWWYPTAGVATQQTLVSFNNGAVSGINIWCNTSGLLVVDDGANAQTAFAGAPFAANQWNHLAVVRSGTTTTGYINGVAVGSNSFTPATTSVISIGRYNGAPHYYASGYISNLRVVNGTAVYTSAFTPPSAPLTAVTNTSILTCQSNRFIDRSTNAYTITRNGDVSVQTFSPLATTTAYSPATHGGSAYFDGSGDFLSVASNSAFDIGSSDFTIECWFNANSFAAAFGLISRYGSPPSGWVLRVTSATNIRFVRGADVILDSTTTMTTGSWNHVAVVRSGSTLSVYHNGNRINQATSISNFTDASTALQIGRTNTLADDINGYICDARVVKGTAVYSGTTYTVPTAPLTNIANTSLLCNFTNAQIYDADAANVLETVGDAKVNTAIKKFGAGSIAFDGTGDYLAAKMTPDMTFGSGDMTIECWVYPTTISGTDTIFDTRVSGAYGNDSFTFQLNGGVVQTFAGSYSSATPVANAVAIVANTWTHIAFSRASGVNKIFINGTEIVNNTNSWNQTYTATNQFYIGQTIGIDRPFHGYIDDLRISKGLARYRYNFTPPTRAFATKGGTQTLTADEDFEYTTLLLSGNGTANSNNHAFIDSSNNNFAITRNGNATQGTFSPFSQTGWSNYFDGTGDSLQFTHNADLTFGSGNFTVEAWLFTTRSTGISQPISGIWDDNSSAPQSWIWYTTSGKMRFTIDVGGADTLVLDSPNEIPTNQWFHAAIVRNGSTWTMYWNGVAVVSGTSSATISTGSAWLGIGSYQTNNGNLFQGYISNYRIVKGSAVYTSNFTPSTTPLTAIANTTLLTCQSNRFRDASNNNFAITRNGDVSVQAFSPFAPTASYAAANVGGSVYFDGSGDWLEYTGGSISTSADFTIELWFYHIGTMSGNKGIFCASASRFGILAESGTNLYILGSPNDLNTGTAIPINQWNHIAVTRTSGTLRAFLNGTQAGGTVSNSQALSQFRIGNNQGGEIVSNCYISGIRVLVGTGGTSITVPTAPPTAISNTNFLCNFTNAGITDATAKTVVETLGDAKISTVQSKFGGSSIAFDGTGDYLLVKPTVDLEFGNGDFTIEFWWYPTSTTRQGLYHGSFGTDWSVGIDYSSVSTNQKIGIWASSNGTGWNLINADSGGNGIGVTTITQNAWNHIAYVRYGTTWMLFVNGNRDLNLTGISGTIVNRATSQKSIGSWWSTGSMSQAFGYMDDFRITKGIARYVQNFTPPTSAFLTR